MSSLRQFYLLIIFASFLLIYTANSNEKANVTSQESEKSVDSADLHSTPDPEKDKKKPANVTKPPTSAKKNKSNAPKDNNTTESLHEKSDAIINELKNGLDKSLWNNVTEVRFDNSSLTNLTDGPLNVTIIPEDKLCLLCHLIMKQFKEKIASNPTQFKMDMISSCSSLNDSKKTTKCIEKITDAKIKRISKTTVAGLCIQEKLCKQGQSVKSDMERDAPSVAPMDAIPELKNVEKEKAENSTFSTQQRQLLEMYTKQ